MLLLGSKPSPQNREKMKLFDRTARPKKRAVTYQRGKNCVNFHADSFRTACQKLTTARMNKNQKRRRRRAHTQIESKVRARAPKALSVCLALCRKNFSASKKADVFLSHSCLTLKASFPARFPFASFVSPFLSSCQLLPFLPFHIALFLEHRRGRLGILA
jgi:hypothetical protein